MAQATEDKGPAGRIVFSATTARRGRQSRVSKNWVPAGIHEIAMKRNLWVFVLGRSCWAVTACLGAAGRVCEPDPSFRCRTLDHLEGGPADPGSRNRPAPPATVVLGSGGGHSPGRRAQTSPASPASAGPRPDDFLRRVVGCIWPGSRRPDRHDCLPETQQRRLGGWLLGLYRRHHAICRILGRSERKLQPRAGIRVPEPDPGCARLQPEVALMSQCGRECPRSCSGGKDQSR